MSSAKAEIEQNNPLLFHSRPRSARPGRRLGKVLVANRGEIAKRFFFALKEEGIASVAVVADPDRGQSWYEAADEVVYIGAAGNYARGEAILSAVDLSRADGLYPGYGFLSENPDFREALGAWSQSTGRPCVFLGPTAEAMRAVSHKQSARALAARNGVPLFSGSERMTAFPEAREAATRIGYPVMLKLDAGGGGQGMKAIYSEQELAGAIESAQRIGGITYGNSDFYLEKLIERPVHIEVQIFNGTAIGIRKCAVQRRNQKVIEESGDAFLDSNTALRLLAAAESMAAACGYANQCGAGTVEFLFDDATGEFGFLEVNTRLQVEYPVTDQSLGIDLVRWQILCFDNRETEIPYERALRLRFVEKQHAIQCRIYAEDPRRQWAPAPGRIVDLELPTFNGVRCDFGFKSGDTILSEYDPMIGKLIAFGVTREEALLRMERALGELYVRGVTTNVEQLLEIVRHPEFRGGRYTNRILLDHPELSVPVQSEAELREAAVCACAAEMAGAISKAIEACFGSEDLEELLQSSTLTEVPTRFAVEFEGRSGAFRLQFIQWALRSYHVAIDDEPVGSISVSPRGTETLDLHIIFRARAIPVRLDRRSDLILLRSTSAEGLVRYYRMRVRQLGIGRQADAPGMVRSPFQGSFVRFAPDAEGGPLRPGSPVKKGQPLLVLAAMKMETTLTAPLDGRVSFLVDDGDLRRLVRGQSERGLVLGRSIAEGEALVVVEPTRAAAGAGSGDDGGDASAESLEFVRRLLREGPTDPSFSTHRALEILRGGFLGYLMGSESAALVQQELTETKSPPAWPEHEGHYRAILEIYTCLKQMYSAALGKNQTWFGEMHRLLSEWDNDTYRPPYFFRAVMARLLHYYDVPDDLSRKNHPDMRLAFFFILRGYQAIVRHGAFLDTLLRAMAQGAAISRQLLKDLHRFVEQELPDRDDARARHAQRLLRTLRERAAGERALSVRPGQLEMSREDLGFIEEVSAGAWQQFEESAHAVTARLTAGADPEEVGATVKDVARTYVERLRTRARVFVLPSPCDDVEVLFVRHHAGEAGFYCLTYLPGGRLEAAPDSAGSLDIPLFRRAAARTARVLSTYAFGNGALRNHVHMFAAEEPTPCDLSADDPLSLNAVTLRRVVTRTLRYFQHIRAQMVIVDLLCQRSEDAPPERVHLNLYTERGHAAFDIVDETDRAHPFWNGEERPVEQRLHARRKWPVEKWAAFCFDPGRAKEVRIPSVDDTNAPVGARIYRGAIAGTEAVFFMKDSRIKGGATGDREGRKYASAIILAYLLDRPLYVWNDGAGADIREGMISLNRAAEGFFLNALCGSRAPYSRFYDLLCAHPDPVLRALYDELVSLMPELERRSAAPHSSPLRAPQRFFVTAIGVGSATGLDVYGSSQAALQVMLDSPQSYRVLTGAAVVRSVTGEELTNYEIGGAGVMGRWTGTVDFTAVDKLDLLTHVRRLHEFFCGGDSTRAMTPSRARGETADFVVLNERLLESVAEGGRFLNCRSEYQDAAALLGGFVRLGGRPVLVLGPRTHAGIRSFASVTKARELLRAADRLELPRILVFGRRWYRGDTASNDEAVRARMDFLGTLGRGRQVRVHIISHVEGLRRVTLNSGADVLIFVATGRESESELEFARRTAAFLRPNLESAFELAGRLLNLLSHDGYASAEQATEVEASVPDTVETSARSDATASVALRLPPIGQPFDMRSQVLEVVFDSGSLIVLHHTGEGPAREPNLVTAFARLGGRPVAVIGDQPLHGGAPDAVGTEKFRMFVELVERRKLPLVMLSDAPGFVPGTKQERLRIQQIGGESLDVNVLSRVPIVSVVLRQNYGGRQIHAFGRNLRPGIVALAARDSVMAVMGAEASFELFQGREHARLLAQGDSAAAARLRENYIAEFTVKARADQDALRSGALDRTFADLEELRAELLRALPEAEERAAVFPR